MNIPTNTPEEHSSITVGAVVYEDIRLDVPSVLKSLVHGQPLLMSNISADALDRAEQFQSRSVELTTYIKTLIDNAMQYGKDLHSKFRKHPDLSSDTYELDLIAWDKIVRGSASYETYFKKAWDDNIKKRFAYRATVPDLGTNKARFKQLCDNCDNDVNSFMEELKDSVFGILTYNALLAMNIIADNRMWHAPTEEKQNILLYDHMFPSAWARVTRRNPKGICEETATHLTNTSSAGNVRKQDSRCSWNASSNFYDTATYRRFPNNPHDTYTVFGEAFKYPDARHLYMGLCVGRDSQTGHDAKIAIRTTFNSSTVIMGYLRVGPENADSELYVDKFEESLPYTQESIRTIVTRDKLVSTLSIVGGSGIGSYLQTTGIKARHVTMPSCGSTSHQPYSQSPAQPAASTQVIVQYLPYNTDQNTEPVSEPVSAVSEPATGPTLIPKPVQVPFQPIPKNTIHADMYKWRAPLRKEEIRELFYKFRCVGDIFVVTTKDRNSRRIERTYRVIMKGEKKMCEIGTKLS